MHEVQGFNPICSCTILAASNYLPLLVVRCAYHLSIMSNLK